MQKANRTSTVLAKLAVVGDLLMLQLVFLVISLGILTLFPAAFAMQRVLPDAISQERPKLLRRFFAEFRQAMKQYWLPGFGLWTGGLLLAFGISFWAYASGPVRIFALAILIPLTGMILGLYLSGLAILPESSPTAPMKTLFRSANLFLLRRPLPVAGGVVVLLTWFALASQVPTLLVVGSGLVPALTAYRLSRPRREKTSEDVSI
ncbi:YesL family protein [Kribbella sp. NPDC048928]|uniref:YesL family protein n=1 Tax=Kribbella sp. NPDC048928 TaxID=3364111 RepID=UPI003720DE10